LPVAVDERYERDRYAEDSRDQSGQAIEGLLGWTVEEARGLQRTKTSWIGKP
jgi:hypothetical protein